MSTQRRGVTLLELLIVLVIVGLVGAMVVPNIRGADANARLRSAGEIVANYANTARRASIARGAPARLRVRNDTLIWVTLEREDGTEALVADTVRLTEYGAMLALTNEATLAADTMVRFDKRGIARGLGNSARLLVLTSSYTSAKDTVCISGVGMVVRGGC